MVGLESLDDLDLARLDLLKVLLPLLTPADPTSQIDAQGMEQGVLLGARHTIRKHLPVIYMEYESSSPKLFKLIKSLGGYKCYSHAPRLYKDSNFRGEKINIFGQIRSFNVYCVAKSSMKVPGELSSF
ncbi:hypothetical protein GUITHDRAFT_105846 [Guillardia theta CCMP2712]|uniref:Methyltransferase FkbM domain-containing protein n=1 Tax=Guillardia theta (strain CCMP2712) TaxID=905079 RepID=L1JJH3_GUITC|nr:hypothetical protein GUITHDRAFT_105846 [Guillardia theta CCMP2712]EKX48240.1 hypothetical protein GUITHDRAFT_105846 [Guillardia theta CCMP2712]|eukprot:XP_005835220.1 hypothetical protein GUITHDRAFT_105846 [Guillardia theta CCMP2712]